MVIDDAHQIHPVHAFELKGEDVDLPHRIGQLPLKTTDLWRPAFRFRWLIAKARVVDHPTHRFCAYLKPLTALQFVADFTHPCFWVPAAIFF
ncbi:MAG: hypothetical protein ACXACH_03605, partial [Candidatus Hermodarchaeia archaeon]